MLDPDVRAVLLDQLRPPVGFELDHAIATTFTLDLEAALIPPLAFAARALRSGADPVTALEAIRSCAGRVDIFCQAGCVAVPTQASDLVAFLAPMVHELKARPGYLFHPKLWVLRYADEEGNASHRLLCLTRNLTNDRAWDVSVRLDGTLGTRRLAINSPLVGLLRALPSLMVRGRLSPDRLERFARLIEEVQRVDWSPPEDVNDLAFYVYGISGLTNRPDFTGYRHLIVSPFVTDDGLAIVAPDRADVSVVSRVEELDKLSPGTVDGVHGYHLSSVAGLEGSAEPTALRGGVGQEAILSGLHAKLYVTERQRQAHVFIGSANATGAAFHGNVEVLVELIGGPSRLGVDTFLGGDAPFRALLEEYQSLGGAPPDPMDEARRRLEEAVRALASASYVAEVTRTDARFAVAVRSQEPLTLPADYRATVELLTRLGTVRAIAPNEPLEATFTNVDLAEVTPFLVLRVGGPGLPPQGTVVKATLLNDPEGRLEEIMARQVDTPEKFFRFLALLLGLQDGSPIPLPSRGDAGAGDTWTDGHGTGVFEIVVRGLADRPDEIQLVDRLVRRLEGTEQGRQTMGEGFLTLWQTVMRADALRRKVDP